LQLDTEADSIDKLAIAFKRFRVKGKLSKQASELYQKAKWSVYDRKKFELFVAEAKTLVDGLQEITKSLFSLPQQRKLMTSAIESIKDVRTHILIADVCEDDYPELSEVSVRATETGSLLPEDVQRIDEWKLEVGTSNDTEDPFEELESMTTTELKHMILQLTQRRPQEATTSIAIGKLYMDIDFFAGIDFRASRNKWEPKSHAGSSIHIQCPVEGCPAISITPSDGKKHLARHKLKHVCKESGCARNTQGFATIIDLTRHMITIHKQRTNTPHLCRCLVPGCNRLHETWLRKDNFKSHLRKANSGENVDELTRQSQESWKRRCQSRGPKIVIEEPKPPSVL
jgi:hypothetical protein